MRARLILAAAVALAAVPLAGAASAKCTQPMSAVCNAYTTVCARAQAEVDKIDCAQV